ncbi:hypothetical protein BJX65DRAFT_306210 [Aspergillus insuetus]
MGFLKRSRSSRSAQGPSRSTTPPPDYDTATRHSTLPPHYEYTITTILCDNFRQGAENFHRAMAEADQKPRKRDTLRKWLKKVGKKARSAYEKVVLTVAILPCFFYMIWKELSLVSKIVVVFGIVGFVLLAVLV